MNLLSYHNDSAIKEKYIRRLQGHRKAERLVQGQGWSGQKGCAVGCTLENYDHSQYPIELGIPTWLAHLEDVLFERLPKMNAEQFAEDFLKAIPVGVDLEQIKIPFLEHVLDSVCKIVKNLPIDLKLKEKILSANRGVGESLRSADAARAAAYAADAVRAAARAARAAAYAADAVRAAARAARAAAYAADDAADADADAAAYAADAAADAATYAADADDDDAVRKIANKLIELLHNAKKKGK